MPFDWFRKDDKKPHQTAKRPAAAPSAGNTTTSATAKPSPMKLAVEKLTSEMAVLKKTLKAEREKRQSLELQVVQLQETLAGLQDSLAVVQKQYRQHAESHEDAHKRRSKRGEWCSPALLESRPEVPDAIRKNTFTALQDLIRWRPATYAALKDPLNFRREEHWGLYWLLANAAAKAAAATRTQNEDGGSTAFTEYLHKTAKELQTDGVFSAGELMRVERIYHNRSAAVLEKDVGADLLLVVSGESLIGRTGLRLFWLQAKRPDKTTFELNYWRDTKNDGGLRQVKALASVHAPERGSFGLYLQYLQELESTYALHVSDVPLPYGTDEKSCTVSMTGKGARLQEMLAGLITNSSVGTFESSDDAVGFLRAQVTRPCAVLALTPEHDDRARELVEELDAADRAPQLGQEREERPGNAGSRQRGGRQY